MLCINLIDLTVQSELRKEKGRRKYERKTKGRGRRRWSRNRKAEAAKETYLGENTT